jgi:NitT/TauT family transport system substrate-binding protein
MKKRILIVVIVGILLASAILASVLLVRHEPSTVRIGYLPISGSLPAYVAIEKSYFKDLGLNPELIKFSNSNTMMTALLAGQIDVATSPSAVDVLASAIKFPGKFKIFRAGYTTKKDYVSAVIVKRDSSYQTLKDLTGKKIGTFPGSTMTMYTRLVFEKAVSGSIKVEIVPLPPTSQLQALVSGSIDACLILEPTGIIGEEMKISRYVERAVVEKYVSDPWVAGFSVISQTYIENNPTAAAKCVEAFNHAIKDLREDPVSGAAYLSKYNDLSPEMAKKVPVPISWIPEEFDKVPIADLVSLLRKQGIIESDVNVDALLYRH